MDKLKTGLLIKSALIALILLIFQYPALSQNQTGQLNVIDSVDDDEDLFDENTNYKELYKDLNKDGDWFTMKESELDSDSDEGEEVTTNVTNIRIINVWRPKGMSADWSPYNEGRWVYTYNGWIWVTDYQWGWAAYHYGRWVYSAYYGWVWLPGRYWAPNWVQWGYNHNCIGWYPVYPRWRGWHHGRHHHGWYDRFYHHGKHKHWVFVNRNRFTEKINEKTRLNPDENGKILEGAKTKVIVKFDGRDFVNIGPKVEVIEKNTGQKIQPKEVTVNPVKGITKVDDKSVSIFRNDSPKNKEKVTKTGDSKTVNNGQKKKEDVQKNNNGSRNNENGTKNNENGQKSSKNKTRDTNKEKSKQSPDLKNGEKNEKPPDVNSESRNENAKKEKENNGGNEGRRYENKNENAPPDNNSPGSNESNRGGRNNENRQNNEGSKERNNQESRESGRK